MKKLLPDAKTKEISNVEEESKEEGYLKLVIIPQ